MFAKVFVYLKPEQIKVILQIIVVSEVWIKKSKSDTFNVSQGLFEGAEVFERMGMYILSKINIIFHFDNHGIYWDDGLMAVPDNKRNKHSIRKKLHKMFKNLDFNIKLEINRKVVQFWDTELNLFTETIPPITKPNTALSYVNTASNHMSIVIKHILLDVQCSLSKKKFR